MVNLNSLILLLDFMSVYAQIREKKLAESLQGYVLRTILSSVALCNQCYGKKNKKRISFNSEILFF